LAQANLLNGVLLGLLLALTLLALLQYLVTARPAFLAYSLMALLMIAFVLQFEGYNFAYLWPEQGNWNQYAPVLLVAGIQAMQALFAISLFDLQRRYPGLYRLYLLYLILLPLTVVLFFFVQWTWPALLLGLLYVPLVCGAGIFLLRQGVQVAGFFLAGAVGNALFSNLLFGLSVFSLTGSANPFVFPKIGYLCEALFFAVALAHQLHALQRQVEMSLRRHLAEAEQLARSEADKHRALLAAQERQLQLAATGHDLSQPLAAIRLGLTALRASGANEAATRHIDQALDFTESLLHGLVAEAKAELAEQPQELSLEELLGATQERHLATAQSKGLALRYHPSARRLHGSPLILARILDNLVSNAIRYTPQGRVLLGVRWRREGVEIQVRDSGPGIDLARRQQLLAPFTQSGSRSEERHGHGLGLYIVHTLCAQSGYRLEINARPGRGSVFGVFIPA
jgi:signal transduction histidine kinase